MAGDLDSQTFGRLEAAVFVAVETANGGELCTLEQVVAVFGNEFHGERPPAELAQSVDVLIRAGLVEWTDDELGLTVTGRRFLRHVARRYDGSEYSPKHPERVLEALEHLAPNDIAEDGLRPAPNAAQIKIAIEDLLEDEGTQREPIEGDLIAPSESSIFPTGVRTTRLEQIKRFSSSLKPGALA